MVWQCPINGKSATPWVHGTLPPEGRGAPLPYGARIQNGHGQNLSPTMGARRSATIGHGAPVQILTSMLHQQGFDAVGWAGWGGVGGLVGCIISQKGNEIKRPSLAH